MKTKKIHKSFLNVMFTVVVIVLIAGCSSSKNLSGDSKKGVMLRYSFPEKQALKYQANFDIKQILDINGQEFIVDIGQYLAFSTILKSKSKTENHIHIDIDTMDMTISSPQGDLKPDTKEVNGSGFDMILSTLGSGLDVSGAEAIQYEVSPGVKRNVAMTFKFLFPRLPEQSLKIGDTWSMVDTIIDKNDNEEVVMIIDSDYTLAGFETVNGLDCARITSVVTGTRTGKAIQQGVEMQSEGTMEGSGTYFFAQKNGYLLKDVSSITVDATLEIQGPQKRSIPMKFEINNKTELRR